MIYSYIPQYHLEISFFSMSSQISLVTYSRILPGIDENFINPWYYFFFKFWKSWLFLTPHLFMNSQNSTVFRGITWHIIVLSLTLTYLKFFVLCYKPILGFGFLLLMHALPFLRFKKIKHWLNKKNIYKIYVMYGEKDIQIPSYKHKF